MTSIHVISDKGPIEIPIKNIEMRIWLLKLLPIFEQKKYLLPYTSLIHSIIKNIDSLYLVINKLRIQIYFSEFNNWIGIDKIDEGHFLGKNIEYINNKLILQIETGNVLIFDEEYVDMFVTEMQDFIKLLTIEYNLPSQFIKFENNKLIYRDYICKVRDINNPIRKLFYCSIMDYLPESLKMPEMIVDDIILETSLFKIYFKNSTLVSLYYKRLGTTIGAIMYGKDSYEYINCSHLDISSERYILSLDLKKYLIRLREYVFHILGIKI
jgi:hypothetical protein